MVGTNLFPDETGFSPRPAWHVIEAARRQFRSGELTLVTQPPTRIYMRDGVVYFAERSSDYTLPVRLKIEGVINREQLMRGTVTVNGVEHIGRMFDADPTIDRTSVEVCTERLTDDLMVEVANETIVGYKLVLYRRHPSGVDRWYQPALLADVSAGRDNLFAAPNTQPVSVTPPLAAAVDRTPPSITEPVPIVMSVSTPLTAMPAPSPPVPENPADDIWSDVDVSAIADEVAAAIDRAFAAAATSAL